MARTTAAEWSRRVARWERSGLSARAFGEREGIEPRQLSWWKWRLRSGTARSPSSSSSSPTFVPVRVVRSDPGADIDSRIDMRERSSAVALEIVAPSGVRIRVLPGFDEATLERVLELVGARPC